MTHHKKRCRCNRKPDYIIPGPLSPFPCCGKRRHGKVKCWQCEKARCRFIDPLECVILDYPFPCCKRRYHKKCGCKH